MIGIFVIVTILLRASVATPLPEAASASIMDFGAVANSNTVSAAQANSKAIEAAAKSVTAAGTGGTVVVPDNQTFYIHPVSLSDLHGLTLELSGELRAHNNISAWPRDAGNNTEDVISIDQCTEFTLTGTGTLDGQGYDWWWWAILGGFSKLWHDDRPHLMRIKRTKGIVLEGIQLRNSPQFHVKLDDCADLVARHMSIYVDVDLQKSMLRQHGLLRRSVGTTADGRERDIEIPIFPLNTDGFDPSVNGVHIYNVTIENFDDAVAVKPCNTDPGHLYCNCSSNMLIENSTVRLGVGMTIGSVPPNDNVNCVENVLFRNIVFHEPLKGVYMKTNPGDHGSGVIRNVTYENLEIIDPVWWGIYIGPQQQEQPDGGGPGCMTYPLEPCETQPRVPMDAITLRNVVMSGGINPFAGVVRCNESRPCTNFLFENVHVKEALDTENYILEYVEGTAIDCAPVPNFAPNPSALPPVEDQSRNEARQQEPSKHTKRLHAGQRREKHRLLNRL
eukprot:scpid52596/ scgid14535/ Probable exopolygalacturonase X; Galacturan 1,4-alpha-galacturonidase; Poly(1,4-alpha-D-galacturonide)galacturonohydrolase; Probable exopolygalacturonase X; Galacturan 1,4-alpha-galacturonidase; Poly(1,4-alpha-D-galacturonide)galacturonohydrolase